jgi:hypothetical protein
MDNNILFWTLVVLAIVYYMYEQHRIPRTEEGFQSIRTPVKDETDTIPFGSFVGKNVKPRVVRQQTATGTKVTSNNSTFVPDSTFSSKRYVLQYPSKSSVPNGFLIPK